MKKIINKVAILGAGSMGVQLATLLASIDVRVLLYDVPAINSDDINLVSRKALLDTLHNQPGLLQDDASLHNISPQSYEDLSGLNDCELIIETIADNYHWKLDLYKKIVIALSNVRTKQEVILATNTSGLSINRLASNLPDHLKTRFMGMHFFNPPAKLKFIELIPHQDTDHSVIQRLISFAENQLASKTVIANDTPNFISNRIGVFSLMLACYFAEKYHLSPQIVDLLTGELIGRSKAATFGTIDYIGIDNYLNIVNNFEQELVNDPWQSFFNVPDWIKNLAEKGYLGRKTNQGIYKYLNKDSEFEKLIYDPLDNDWGEIKQQVDKEVLIALQVIKQSKLNSSNCWNTKIKNIRNLAKQKNIHACFIWDWLRELFLYAAYTLPIIADKCYQVDLALQCAYGFKDGLFKLWQMADWHQVASYIAEDAANKKTLTATLLPNWCVNPTFRGPYLANFTKTYSIVKNDYYLITKMSEG